MKKMRFIVLVMTVILLLSLLTGCGSSYDKVENGAAMAPTGSGIYENGTDKENTTVETGRKLIRTVTIRSETDDQDALLSELEARVAALGGYVQSKNVNNSQTGRRTATLVLRIPAEQLDAFVDHVEGATNILSVNENAEDITLNYIATESRVKALETEEARLLELLAQANNLDEILRLESRLTEVRTELERHRSQLKLYDNLVDYATVNLTITEVKEYTVVEEEEPSAWQRIGSGFVNSLKGVWTIIREVFIFFIVALPYLALVAVIPVSVVVIVRLCLRAKRKRRARQAEMSE